LHVFSDQQNHRAFLSMRCVCSAFLVCLSLLDIARKSARFFHVQIFFVCEYFSLLACVAAASRMTRFHKQACCRFSSPVQTICSRMACLAKTSGVWAGSESITGILFSSGRRKTCSHQNDIVWTLFDPLSTTFIHF
jgi:hypothetical protein